MGSFFFAGVCTWACLSLSRVVVDFLEPRKKGKTRKSANAAITKGPNSPSPRFIFEIVTRNGYRKDSYFLPLSVCISRAARTHLLYPGLAEESKKKKAKKNLLCVLGNALVVGWRIGDTISIDGMVHLISLLILLLILSFRWEVQETYSFHDVLAYEQSTRFSFSFYICSYGRVPRAF